MNIKLNLKSIIKFEQFTGKSFQEIDYTNNDEMMQLLYCIVLSNNDNKFLYNDFTELMGNKKLSKEIVDKFQLELKLIEQFTEKKEPDEINDKGEITGKTETLFIKDIVTMLTIHAGMDVNYIMNELNVYDIQLFMNSYNEKVKQEMESKRLFTYLSILPHIDGKKLNTPAKLYSFPWDIKEKEKEVKKITESDFDEIMKKSKEYIVNNIIKKETIK